MDLIENIDDLKQPYPNAVITIGCFDGVHKGHRTLITEALRKAREIDGTSVVVTFEPHPQRVLSQKKHPPLITRYDQKVELIRASGIDVLIFIPFTKAFAQITAKAFIEDILIGKVGMKAIVMGKDYSFGKNREGDQRFLAPYAERSLIEVIIPDWVPISRTNTERISSTNIRKRVMEGDMEGAREQLGRHYQIRGKVVKGRNRGAKLLGFPTANIKLHDELCPKIGVYAVTVESSQGHFIAVANIGFSPTFDDHVFTIEVHILDFTGDLYDQRIRVNFHSRLRDERKFSGIAELSEQILSDIQKARTLLQGTEAGSEQNV